MSWVQAEEQQPLPSIYPSAMASLGDSMSEAILADFAYEDGIPASEIWRMIGFGSISDPDQKIQAFRNHYAALGKVWITGDDETSLVYSHYQRLKELNPEIIAENFSVAGSESRQLGLQVDELLAVEEEQDILFDYVSVLIGANDLNRPSLDEVPSALSFVSNVESGLRRILETRDRVWILVVGLPDVFRVFDQTQHLVVLRTLGSKITCDDMRNTIYGKSALFQKEGTETRRKMRALYHQYQEALVNMVERLQKEYPAAQIKAIDPVVSQQKASKVISIDCFHPSEFGQAEIAELTWDAGFWGGYQPSLPMLSTAKLGD